MPLRAGRRSASILPWTSLCTLLCAQPALADPSPAYLVKDVTTSSTSNFRILDLAAAGGGTAWLTGVRPAPWGYGVLATLLLAGGRVALRYGRSDAR